MPRGDKSSYTSKQKRQAEHIEDSAKKKGRSAKTAERIAWATVNKQDGGGKKSGSGRKRSTAKKSTAKKSTAKRGAKAAARKRAARKAGRASAAKRRRSK